MVWRRPTRLKTDGYRIDPHTATPDWHGARLDLHWAMTVLPPATADLPCLDVPAGTDRPRTGMTLVP